MNYARRRFSLLNLIGAAAGALAASAAFPAPAAAQQPSSAPPAALAQATTIAVSTPEITVVWPKDGDSFPFIQRSFTFGTVTPGSTLTINGRNAAVDPDGVFFEMIGFSSGSFAVTYNATWQGVTVSTRHVVNIAPPYGPDPEPGHALALEPSSDKELLPGETFPVKCKGPPGLAASFSIHGLPGTFPLVENSSPSHGVYAGFYTIQPGDSGRDLTVTCRLKSGFWSSLSAEAKGKISILERGRTRTAVTTAKWSVIKTQSNGYSLFLPEGVRLEIAGRDGSLAHVVLADGLDGWIDSSSIRLLPEGTPPPRAVIGQNVSTSVSSDSVRVHIETGERVPFEVSETLEPLRYTIRFYNAAQRFDRMHYASDDPVLRGIRGRQERDGVVEMTLDTRLRQGWGYLASYDAEGRFVFEIRRPPGLVRDGKPVKNVLAGRRIVIDPGHGPDTGAEGPRGTLERDVNLAIAFKLRDMLLNAGADPYMIRTSSDGPALIDRPIEARKAGGELYVSIHNNALPVSADPFSPPRGYMLFYYHPSSRLLAEAVHRSYQAYLSDLPDELMQWGDLQVCRTTTMPAILTESAYVILPDQEKKLLSAEFQERLAKTLFEGIRTFYEDYQAAQMASPAERAAARVRE